MIAPQCALGPPDRSLSDRGLSDGLALIIEGLCRALGVRSAKDHSVAPLMLLAWTRLRRLSARFASLAAALREGRLAAGSALPASAARLRPAPALSPLPALPQPYRLPRGFGWLLRLAPETAAYGGQVEHWLADPELATLLEKAPQAGRILRPLCRMLGIRPGPALRTPRGRANASAPALSDASPASPDRQPPDAFWSAEPPHPATTVLAGADPPLVPPAPD